MRRTSASPRRRRFLASASFAAMNASGTSIASGSPAREQRHGVRDPQSLELALERREVAGGRPARERCAPRSAARRGPSAAATALGAGACTAASNAAGGAEPPGSSASGGGGSAAPWASASRRRSATRRFRSSISRGMNRSSVRPVPACSGERGGAARRVVGDDRSLERREILGALVLGECGAERVRLAGSGRRAGEQVDRARELALA